MTTLIKLTPPLLALAGSLALLWLGGPGSLVA